MSLARTIIIMIFVNAFFVAFYLIDDSAEILKQFNYLMASHMPEFSKCYLPNLKRTREFIFKNTESLVSLISSNHDTST